MKIVYDLSEMLAGIGIFLLGMNFLEDTLKNLAGRSFKLFLRRQTTSKLKAIGGGAILTGVLQSSSVVNLMVLAFVGAGVLTMQNALAVVLGANVGTTLTSWIVASLGFKFDIQNFALPIVGIAGICMAMFRQGTPHQWSKFAFGFGAIFVGLGFIKTGFEDLVMHVDFSLFRDYPAIIFVIIGFILTSLIQASSATIAITLSALYTDAITLHSAMAIVLGSEVGTTIKLLLASTNGIPAKKQVAFGNFIYNTFVIVCFLIILSPINYFITEIIDIKDNLLALVIFQSGINIAGVIIFYPFLKFFGKFLENRFKDDDEGSRYIRLVPASESELALDALTKEARWFMDHTIDFILESVGYPLKTQSKQEGKVFENQSHSEKYDHLKRLYGEMHSYYILINKEELTADEKERVDQVISCVRNSMFAAKSMKDSMSDINQFKNSSNDAKYRAFLQTRESVKEFCDQLNRVLNSHETTTHFEEIVHIYNELQKGYIEKLSNLYKEEYTQLNEIEISTFINFNRELHSTYKALIWAVKDYLLDKNQSVYFSELPGFIR
jgi:phosphate:Na+ symporter